MILVRMETFSRAGNFVTAVSTLFDAFKLLFTLSGVLSRAIKFKTSVLCLQEKMEIILCLIPRPQTVLRWTLSSLINLHVVKDHSRYLTAICLFISYHSFWFSNLQMTRCPYALLTLLPFKMLQSGAKTFPSGRVTFEIWLADRKRFCHARGPVVCKRR